MNAELQERHQQASPRTSGIRGVLFGLLICLGLAALGLWKIQAVIDWWHLHDYTPSAQISAVADKTTMSNYGRHLFYVNHPELLTASTFSSQCQVAAEKTIVLGCYKSGDRGIYLYNVTDERLNGVIETTAAHEMLHAAYARLSPSEKERIDSQLESFYKSSLQDERIKSTIEAYKTSEPTEIDNEMHSIFATEVSNLPSDLESYYTKYFSDRKAVVAMAERYQAEFTNRRDQAEIYDKQLSDLKPQIDTNQAEIRRLYDLLGNMSARLNSLKKANAIDEYNQLVETYNSNVHAYNALLETTKSQIDEYNDIVSKRNALALETRDLTKALSGKSL